MSHVHQCLWSTGQWLVSLGLITALSIAIAASMQEPQIPNWIQIAGGWATVAILIGAVILWAYALRFYFKIQANLRVPRNALYLVLVICLNWISPIAFMILEGKDRFFEVAFE